MALSIRPVQTTNSEVDNNNITYLVIKQVVYKAISSSGEVAKNIDP